MDFNLEALGWKHFQDLAITIANIHYGIDVRVFAAGRDGGRDGGGIFPASLSSSSSRSEVTVQSKHTSTHATLTLNSFKNELPKIRDLFRKGFCDQYYLFTNRRLSATSDADISHTIKAIGVHNVKIVGRETIQHILTENKDLRACVPRIYGLGDLSEILDERIYEQTQKILRGCEPERFVATQSYFDTIKALSGHGMAVLLGAPGSGKSSIMSMAAIHCADQWELSPVWLADINQLQRYWNPHRDDQLFLLDDAFGTTSLDIYRAHTWTQLLPYIRGALNGNSRIILTSRDYVYGAARPHLKAEALPRSQEDEVLISLQDLSIDERRQIVYNHLKHGNHDERFLRSLKPHLNRITWTSTMLPVAASRLGNSIFTRQLDPTDSNAVAQFLLDPRQYLRGVIEALDENLQGALTLIMAEGGTLDTDIPRSIRDSEIWRQFGLSSRSVGRALEALEGGFLILVVDDDRKRWTIRHPSIIDALGDWMLEHDDLLETYVTSAPIDHLTRQVSCGDGVKGAVSLPQSLWQPTIDRLLSDNSNSEAALRFLAYRCRSKALRTVCNLNDLEELLQNHAFTAPLENDAGVRLFLRLDADKALEDGHVHELLNRIIATAVKEFDPYVIRNLSFEQAALQLNLEDFNWPTIIERFVQHVANEMGSYITNQMAQYVSQVDRAEVFAGLLDLMSAIGDYLETSHPLLDLFEDQRQRILAWCSVQTAPIGVIQDRCRALVHMVFTGSYSEDIDIFSDVDIAPSVDK